MAEKGYDLTNELGPENRYDQIAAQAQITGARYGNRRLVESGTRLSQMIRDIPYHNDNFSQVISFADDLKRKIDRQNRSIFLRDKVLNESTPSNKWREKTHLRLYKEGNNYVINFFVARQHSTSPTSQHEVIKTLFQSIAGINEHTKVLQTSSGRPLGGSETISTYYSQDQEPLYASSLGTHENHEDHFFKEMIYFYDENTAIATWNKICAQLEEVGIHFEQPE